MTTAPGAKLEVSNDILVYGLRIGRGPCTGGGCTPDIYSTVVGYGALTSNTSGYSNTALGGGALTTNTSGYYNTALGFDALGDNLDGHDNIGVGGSALSANHGGDYNTAMGGSALATNYDGDNNTAVGWNALAANYNSANSTAVGTSALFYNTAAGSTAVGYQALRNNTSGNYNTAVGFDALQTNGANSGSTAVGYQASYQSTGEKNTAVGAGSLLSCTSGKQNTAVGYMAGQAIISYSAGSSGYGNTFVGYQADAGGNYYNCGAFGNGAVATGNNMIYIGNSAITTVANSPNSWTSDGRFKTNVSENVKGLDFVLKLRPVTFNFEGKKFDEYIANGNPEKLQAIEERDYTDAENIKWSGFIAQEVEQAADQSDYTFAGVITPKGENGYYSLVYMEFVVPLVKAVQELDAINNAQYTQIENLQSVNQFLTKRIDDLEAAVYSSTLNDGSAKISMSESNKIMLGQNIPMPR